MFSYSGLPEDLISEASFILDVEILAPGNALGYEITENSAPFFVPVPPAEISAYIGEAFSYEFGQAFDIEGDQVEVTIALGIARSFA